MGANTSAKHQAAKTWQAAWLLKLNVSTPSSVIPFDMTRATLVTVAIPPAGFGFEDVTVELGAHGLPAVELRLREGRESYKQGGRRNAVGAQRRAHAPALPVANTKADDPTFLPEGRLHVWCPGWFNRVGLRAVSCKR